MDKPNILKLLPAILGFLAIALPAIGGDKGDLAIWLFGGVFEEGEISKFNFLESEMTEMHPELFLAPVSGVLFAAGAVLVLLSAFGVLKLDKLAWLPGVIMLAGVPLYFIAVGNTELIAVAPIVINIACGAVGGIWALVDAIKSRD